MDIDCGVAVPKALNFEFKLKLISLRSIMEVIHALIIQQQLCKKMQLPEILILRSLGSTNGNIFVSPSNALGKSRSSSSRKGKHSAMRTMSVLVTEPVREVKVFIFVAKIRNPSSGMG
jgi:hypothetical protein